MEKTCCVITSNKMWWVWKYFLFSFTLAAEMQKFWLDHDPMRSPWVQSLLDTVRENGVPVYH